MADDIGKALDFVVGFAQVGGALVDGAFEIEIGVAQFHFGLVASARRTPHQEDREAGERDDEAGAGQRDDRGELLAAIGVCRPQRELPVFLHAHRVRDIADRGRHVASRDFADQGGRARAVVPLDEAYFLCELGEPRFDGRAQLRDVLALNRIIADQMGKLVELRDNGGDGLLMVGQKFWP